MPIQHHADAVTLYRYCGKTNARICIVWRTMSIATAEKACDKLNTEAGHTLDKWGGFFRNGTADYYMYDY